MFIKDINLMNYPVGKIYVNLINCELESRIKEAKIRLRRALDRGQIRLMSTRPNHKFGTKWDIDCDEKDHNGLPVLSTDILKIIYKKIGKTTKGSRKYRTKKSKKSRTRTKRSRTRTKRSKKSRR
jgi:hypothetical protein